MHESKTVSAVSCTNDGRLISIVVFYNGEDFYSFVMEESNIFDTSNISTTIYEHPSHLTSMWISKAGNIFICDTDGFLHSRVRNEWKQESICDHSLFEIYGLDDDNIFCAGAEGIIYHKHKDKYLSSKLEHKLAVLCIQGTSLNNLFACGDSGLLVKFNGTQWNSIPIPTNKNLTGVLAVSETEVYVAGDKTLLQMSNNTSWVDLSKSDINFYKITQFQDRLYIMGGSAGVFRLDGDQIVNVKNTFSAYESTSNSNYLAVAGMNTSVCFDGSLWYKATYD